MSSRFYLGPSPGGHALRVMKNATDDPVTTEKHEYDKFAFDSEVTNLGYTHKIGTLPSINDLPYSPFVTSMVRYQADWWNVTRGMLLRDSGYSNGTWKLWETQHGAWVNRDTVTGNQSIEMVSHCYGNTGGIWGPQVVPLESRNLVWRLPADQSAHPYPPSSGNIEVFYKYGSAVRLPRPGFSHLDTDLNNFIIHEDLSPAKLIRSGRLTIPAGSGQYVEIQIPPEIGDNIVIGGNAGPVATGPEADFITIPQLPITSDPESIERTIQARFMGGGVIRFREERGKSAFFSYFIAAENNSLPTVGAGGFLRSHGSGSNAYVQMCRPGSGENPSLSDIILDSRWGVMPIIAQGFVPGTEFAGLPEQLPHAIVTFPTQEYVPLTFVSWVFEGVRGPTPLTTVTTTPGTVGHVISFAFDFPYVNSYTGYCRWATVQRDRITFIHSMGVTLTSIHPNSGNIYYDSWQNRLLGVRYYVFAVPQS